MSILLLYSLLSIASFAAYALDKAAARGGRRRIPENTLHLLALAGGWPGALVAQKLFRHKTRKQPFRTIFWVTVAINVAALIWVFTPEGASAWQSLVSSVIQASG